MGASRPLLQDEFIMAVPKTNKDGLVGGSLVSIEDFLEVQKKKRVDKKLIARQKAESDQAAQS